MAFNILWHFNDLLWDIMQAKALIYSAVIWFYPKENESGSQCPGLSNGLHFRASQPDANFSRLHGAPNYRSYRGIHGSSIFRETVRKRWPATDYSDVMSHEPVIILHYRDQVTYSRVITASPSAGLGWKETTMNVISRTSSKISWQG